MEGVPASSYSIYRVERVKTPFFYSVSPNRESRNIPCFYYVKSRRKEGRLSFLLDFTE